LTISMVNIFLTNKLNNVHPPLLYYSLVFIYLYATLNKKKFFYLKLTFYITTYLGGWWAVQEINWGGWWNWDFIEVILLFFIIFSLILIHFNKYSIYVYILYLYVLYLLVLNYTSIRLNLFNSIHNFTNIFLYKNYIYIILIALNYLVILYLYSYTNVNFYLLACWYYYLIVIFFLNFNKLFFLQFITINFILLKLFLYVYILYIFKKSVIWVFFLCIDNYVFLQKFLLQNYIFWLKHIFVVMFAYYLCINVLNKYNLFYIYLWAYHSTYIYHVNYRYSNSSIRVRLASKWTTLRFI